MLTDSSGNITWATPLEGSRLAHLVNNPLPIAFHVTAETTTTLHPQVVRIGSHHPSDFGYVNFDVDFVERMCLKIYFESGCYSIYDDSILTASGDFAPVYPSYITVRSEGKVLLRTHLVPGMNRISLPRGYDDYRMQVTDCGEQVCFLETFKPEQLHKFSCYNGTPLEIICHNNDPAVIITPEEIMDPTIEQGVFGRITREAEDTTMTEAYVMEPVVRELYIYHYAEADSIDFFLQEPACLNAPLPFQPVAVVRSNTSGYYQLPLPEGKYVYMVKVQDGFYIDRYISSRIPGKLVIREGEVTTLHIHIIPCWS